jgi:hypothetical protein
MLGFVPQPNVRGDGELDKHASYKQVASFDDINLLSV